MDAFGWPVSNDARLKLYRAVATIFKDRGDKLMRAVALEKAVELSPPDRELRFSAAYAESETALAHLASANYEALIDQDPKSSGVEMNNLGVQADAFKLPIESVALYRSAAKQGEILATAAYKLINQGFIDEARERLDEAKVREDVHSNVNEALADASKRETAEVETWKNIVKQGVAHRLFLHGFAEARFLPHIGPPLLDGNWKAPDGGTFQIEEKDGSALVGVIKTWNQPILSGGSGYFDYTGTTALAYVSPDGARVEVFTVDKDSPANLVVRVYPEIELHLLHIADRGTHRATELKARVGINLGVGSLCIAHAQAHPRPNRRDDDVTAERFPSLGFPPSLLGHRWVLLKQSCSGEPVCV